MLVCGISATAVAGSLAALLFSVSVALSVTVGAWSWNAVADPGGIEGTRGGHFEGEGQCTTPSPLAAVAVATAGAAVTRVIALVYAAVPFGEAGGNTGMRAVAGEGPRDGGTANDGDSRGRAGREGKRKTKKGESMSGQGLYESVHGQRAKWKHTAAARRLATPSGPRTGAATAPVTRQPPPYTRELLRSRPKIRQTEWYPSPTHK